MLVRQWELHQEELHPLRHEVAVAASGEVLPRQYHRSRLCRRLELVYWPRIRRLSQLVGRALR